MGDTHRRLPVGCFRSPRGRKQALIRGDRAVPPDAWDDIPIGDEAMRPWGIARRLLEHGMDGERCEGILRRKFGLPGYQARGMVRHILRRAARWL